MIALKCSLPNSLLLLVWKIEYEYRAYCIFLKWLQLIILMEYFSQFSP